MDGMKPAALPSPMSAMKGRRPRAGHTPVVRATCARRANMPEILEPGTAIGKYRIVAHIATGGMGSVYRAVDGTDGRTLALKVLAAGAASQGRMLERFLREGRHSASLSHPNIVTLFECGHDAGRGI